MNIELKVGDTFKVKNTFYNKNCYYLDKIYTIEYFSKSEIAVYYNFKVSNRKCKCYQCTLRKIGLNCISIADIVIYQTKKEKDRLIKINRILKGVD
jgi:hypothetical protein